MMKSKQVAENITNELNQISIPDQWDEIRKVIYPLLAKERVIVQRNCMLPAKNAPQLFISGGVLMKRIIAVASAILALGILSIGIHHNFKSNEFSFSNLNEDLNTLVTDNSIYVEGNKIIINKADFYTAGAVLAKDAPQDKDFISMNKLELIEFYGLNFYPSNPPEDLLEDNESMGGIYKRNEGTGEIYWSQNLIRMTNADVTRELIVDVEKGKLPFTDIVIQVKGTYETSVIRSIPVLLACFSDENNVNYYAEFFYLNVGFRIMSKNLTQNEFIDAISSIFDSQ